MVFRECDRLICVRVTSKRGYSLLFPHLFLDLHVYIFFAVRTKWCGREQLLANRTCQIVQCSHNLSEATYVTDFEQ